MAARKPTAWLSYKILKGETYASEASPRWNRIKYAMLIIRSSQVGLYLCIILEVK